MSPLNKLSKQLIIDTAFDFVDKEGIDSLSMRKLATVLNVKAMSLYNHINNKDELIDELVDKLVGCIEYIDGEDWQETMRNRSVSMKDILLKHSWGTKPLVSGWNIRPNFLRFFNRSLGSLIDSGFSFGEADHILTSINAYIYGFVLQSLNFPIEEENYQESAEEYKDFFSKDDYPYLWGLSNDIRLGNYSGINDFEGGLEVIIKGIEQTIKRRIK